MNKTKKALLLFSSLSIFKGILSRSVPKAFYNLLLSTEKEPVEFLNAYGDFYSLLSQRGYCDNFAYCLTETALFDENSGKSIPSSSAFVPSSAGLIIASKVVRDICNL